jgi:hypothetical protein
MMPALPERSVNNGHQLITHVLLRPVHQLATTLSPSDHAQLQSDVSQVSLEFLVHLLMSAAKFTSVFQKRLKKSVHQKS